MTSLDGIDLVLASTSPHRRELLMRLTPNFRVVSPEVDETANAHETPGSLAVRLAKAKALAVAEKCAGAVIIGSDQVADLDGKAMGKPGTVENAVRQLMACSGHDVVFHTAVCMVDARTAATTLFESIDTTRVRFLELDEHEIVRYVERERPLDCAGGFKCEGIGIALFDHIESNDPTALIGLPMIALCNLLRRADVDVI